MRLRAGLSAPGRAGGPSLKPKSVQGTAARLGKGTGKTYGRKTCNLSQEGRQPACSMVGKQRASQGAGIPQEGKHRSTKPWFNLGIFKIHRHLRLQGKPNGNSKILTL